MSVGACTKVGGGKLGQDLAPYLRVMPSPMLQLRRGTSWLPGGGMGGLKWSGVDTPLSSSRACPTAFIASPVPVILPGRCHVRSTVLVSHLPSQGQRLPAGCGFRALAPAAYWTRIGSWLACGGPCWLPLSARCACCCWPHSPTHLASYFHRITEGLGFSQRSTKWIAATDHGFYCSSLGLKTASRYRSFSVSLHTATHMGPGMTGIKEC